jgi:hypothetical protein
MPRRPRKQVGQTSFFDSDEGLVSNSREEVEVHADRAVIRIGPLDPQKPIRVVESTHRAVVHHTRDVMQARRAHARRLAPVRPDFKPQGRRVRVTRSGTCPQCGGIGHGFDDEGNFIECQECNR